MKAFLSTLLLGAIDYRLTAVLLIAGSSFLTGCSSLPELHPPKTTAQAHLAELPFADHISTQCHHIWQRNDTDSLENPLYWLRGIECAQRLSPSEAIMEARKLSALTWQDAFKRGILLSTAKVTPVERRRYMTQLDMLATDIPLQVRSLFIVWRDGQRSLLSLSEERNRYSKLQQITESQLHELHQEQQFLRNKLEMTNRKLETMSDIERQLSRRKLGSNYATEVQSVESEQPVKEELP